VWNNELTLEAVEIHPLIQEALGRFETPIAEREIAVQIDDAFPTVMGDRYWLAEVFANFISNSISQIGNTTPDPRITIRSASQGDMIRFEVEDNGTEVEQRVQSRLAEMFSRLREGSTREYYFSNLSIAPQIITRLGGEIGVESTPDQGSTFWFTLPAAIERSGLSAIC